MSCCCQPSQFAAAVAAVSATAAVSAAAAATFSGADSFSLRYVAFTEGPGLSLCLRVAAEAAAAFINSLHLLLHLAASQDKQQPPSNPSLDLLLSAAYDAVLTEFSGAPEAQGPPWGPPWGPQGGPPVGPHGGPQGGFQGGPQGGLRGALQGGFQGGPQGGFQGGPQGGAPRGAPRRTVA